MKARFDPHNSLLYWHPKIEKLGIPLPKTEWVELPQEVGNKMLDEEFKPFRPYLEKIKEKASAIGYPVFIRTDMASDKHNWEKGAFVRHEGMLASHIFDTIEFNAMVGVVGVSYRAIVIREYLELDWRFKAFMGNMPVAKERRYFFNNNTLLCHHPYWFEEAIFKAHKDEGKRHELLGYIPHKLPNKWREMLADINYESKGEIDLLTSYALKIATMFDGYWSVDFACTRKGTWVIIDMANGYASEHYPNCSYELKLKIETESIE